MMKTRSPLLLLGKIIFPRHQSWEQRANARMLVLALAASFFASLLTVCIMLMVHHKR